MFKVISGSKEENQILKHEVEVKFSVIGRAKRAPHWGVQSRFRMIYMYVCCVLKCVGGITCVHAQSQFWVVKSDL